MFRNYAKRSIVQADAIRINWKSAMNEAESITKKKYNSFEDRLHAFKILCDIKQFYRLDDISGYLKYLDKNRSILKGCGK